MYYVIGSGPAGVSVASALIASGRKVTLLDAGLTLESQLQARRIRMASLDRDEWSQDDLLASRTPLTEKGDVAAKLNYGSDHPYRPIPGALSIDYGGLGTRGSYAKGGLSEVWGAAVLPFTSMDLDCWPVSATELEAAHAAVLGIVPVAGVRDDLMRLFPLPSGRLHEPKISRQVKRFMTDLNHSRDRLASSGITFGAARLAVNFSGNSPAESCNYCGHCLHGCPRDLIYSSRHTLASLAASGKLTYIPDVAVKSIVEHERYVTIHGLVQSDSVQFHAERVFLAAGIFNSTAILLHSLDWYDRAVDIADSQYYLFPLLQFVASPSVVDERLHTLAQVFLEIANEQISPHLVHLQVYGYNDLLARMLEHKLGLLWKCVPKNSLLGRLLLVQGYLHSDHSGRIRATLKRRSSGSNLELQGIANPETKATVRRVVRHLRCSSPYLRAMPLGPLLRIMEPGRGFHCGGSFPMAKNPQFGQTDTLGRPAGWRRTHVTDATILPTIPATTITQTVMANAFRIGTQSTRLDPMECSDAL